MRFSQLLNLLSLDFQYIPENLRSVLAQFGGVFLRIMPLAIQDGGIHDGLERLGSK